MKKNVLISIILYFAFHFSVSAFELRGRITDDNLQPVEGVKVLVTYENNPPYPGTTSKNGDYSINIPIKLPNSFKVKITKMGFETYSSTEIWAANKSGISFSRSIVNIQAKGEKKLENLNERIGELKKQMEAKEKEMSKLRKENKVSKEELKRYEDLMNQLNQKIEELQNEVTTLRSKLADTEISMADFEGEVKNLNSKLSDISRQYDELITLLRQKELEIAQLKAKNEELERQKEEAERRSKKQSDSLRIVFMKVQSCECIDYDKEQKKLSVSFALIDARHDNIIETSEKIKVRILKTSSLRGNNTPQPINEKSVHAFDKEYELEEAQQHIIEFSSDEFSNDNSNYRIEIYHSKFDNLIGYDEIPNLQGCQKEKPESAENNHKIGYRRVNIMTKDAIETNSSNIYLYVWDPYEVDGDKVAIYFNKQLILDNYKVTGEKTNIPLPPLVEGDNELAIEALNKGKTGNNTTKATLTYGKKEKEVTFKSNAHEIKGIIITKK